MCHEIMAHVENENTRVQARVVIYRRGRCREDQVPDFCIKICPTSHILTASLAGMYVMKIFLNEIVSSLDNVIIKYVYCTTDMHR